MPEVALASATRSLPPCGFRRSCSKHLKSQASLLASATAAKGQRREVATLDKYAAEHAEAGIMSIILGQDHNRPNGACRGHLCSSDDICAPDISSSQRRCRAGLMFDQHGFMTLAAASFASQICKGSVSCHSAVKEGVLALKAQVSSILFASSLHDTTV